MRRLALLALAATLACGTEPPAITDLTVTGSYLLISLNGKDLPQTQSQTATTKVELVSGTLRLDTGGSWSMLSERRETVAGVATTKFETPSGLWTREGSTVTMVTGTGVTTTGNFVLGKNEITIIKVEDGVTNTYLYKQ
jgi:hypothetical protein